MTTGFLTFPMTHHGTQNASAVSRNIRQLTMDQACLHKVYYCSQAGNEVSIAEINFVRTNVKLKDLSGKLRQALRVNLLPNTKKSLLATWKTMSKQDSAKHVTQETCDKHLEQ